MNNTKHSNYLHEALKTRDKAMIHQIGKWLWIWKKRCFLHIY
ncbi:hypothetical protein [Exiguobacterium acetylicum]|nr:hypothetical protein [Exiguobacterium acetylicum]